jgi:hypothetical protein
MLPTMSAHMFRLITVKLRVSRNINTTRKPEGSASNEHHKEKSPYSY